MFSKLSKIIYSNKKILLGGFGGAVGVGVRYQQVRSLIKSDGLIANTNSEFLLQQSKGDMEDLNVDTPILSTNLKLSAKIADIVQKNNSIFYKLNNPTELKAIEISDDLYRVKFYFAETKNGLGEDNTDNYEIWEEKKRIRGVVSSAVYPRLPEIGHVATTSEYVEISGMKDYLSMAESNRGHIEKTVCISEQLHSLEWILTKARNSKILPNELYERIRIDVRHRARQLHDTARINQNYYQKILDETYKNYSSDANFKRITSSSDIHEFAGQVVAYLSDSYYFSHGDEAITLPAEVLGQKIRFAKVRDLSTRWQGGEVGYNMDNFLRPEAVRSTNALIDSLIKKDSALAMRLATAQELKFLKFTIELDQGECSFRKKEKDINMLTQKILQASKATELEGNLLSQYSFFTAKTSATVPPFITFTSGQVDWNRDSENKDKSEPPKPSKVYLIKGGSEESRREKARTIARQDCWLMYNIYHNKDKSEYAVVFSSEHDTFNLMNFNLAKEFSGTQQLPNEFSTSTFGCEPSFGVIKMSDEPEYGLRSYNKWGME